MFYHVYVLQSQRDKKLYIGYSTQLFRRLRQHNNGLNLSTRHRRPLTLIYFEAFLNEADARRRERYFKTSKGKTTLKQMLRVFLDEKE